MSAPAGRSTVRVVTWNAWWRFGDWSARAAAMAAVLRDVDADVIALQEAWGAADGTDGLADRLAAALGFHAAFVPSPAPEKWHRRLDGDRSTIGNAVVSRWPLTEPELLRLPTGGAADEGRTTLITSVDTPTGTLPLFVTHLNSSWAQSSIRAEQLAATGRRVVEASGDFPPVLCGDFNAAPDFDEIRALSGRRDPLVEGLVLLDAWEVARPLEPGFTWDRRNPHVLASHEPSGRIDYVFVGFPTSGRGAMVDARLVGDEPVDGIWPSDHFGVAVDLATG